MLDSLHHNSATNHPILNRLGKNTMIAADMQIEVDQVAFDVFAENDYVLITLNKYSDVRCLARKTLLPILRDEVDFKTLEAVLDRMNITVFVQNKFLGIMGPKANSILRKLTHWYVEKFV